jgi:hypothetical protein
MMLTGSDVELTVVNQDGVPVDVTGMIGGDKKNPVWFDNFNVQEDNVNAEYAINPVESLDQWILYHSKAIATVEQLLPTGYGILFNACTKYDPSQLESENAKLSGCDPDFSAWSGMPNLKPLLNDMRSCGGHIHVGVDGVNKEQLVKWMDVTLGLPSLFMDSDRQRRSMYGKAGSYRPKPYGVEYRALSNFWAKTPEGLEWAYTQTKKAVEFCFTDMLDNIPVLYSIPKAIDTYDMFMADGAMNWLQKEGIL